MVKNSPANTGDARDGGSIPGAGRSPGVGNGNPFQSSCLENSMDRGTWWTIVHKITKSQIGLTMHAYSCVCALSHSSCPSLCGCMFCSPLAPLSVGFFSSSRDLFNSGIEPASLVSPTLAGRVVASGATSSS